MDLFCLKPAKATKCLTSYSHTDVQEKPGLTSFLKKTVHFGKDTNEISKKIYHLISIIFFVVRSSEELHAALTT